MARTDAEATRASDHRTARRGATVCVAASVASTLRRAVAVGRLRPSNSRHSLCAEARGATHDMRV